MNTEIHHPTSSDTPKKILVTGGGGFLGKAIVRQLLAEGHQVASLSRSRYPDLDAMGVRQYEGDIANAGAIKDAARGMDVVFHVAAKPGVWGAYEDYFRPNVTGTRNVITACKSCNVAMLVYTSSPSVVFDGTDMQGVDESAPYPDDYHAPYPKTKALAERLKALGAENGLLVIEAFTPSFGVVGGSGVVALVLAPLIAI